MQILSTISNAKKSYNLTNVNEYLKNWVSEGSKIV